MNTIILAVVLLGGCFLIHFLMMCKGGHSRNHENAGEQEKSDAKKDDKTHSDRSCCH